MVSELARKLVFQGPSFLLFTEQRYLTLRRVR